MVARQLALCPLVAHLPPRWQVFVRSVAHPGGGPHPSLEMRANLADRSPSLPRPPAAFRRRLAVRGYAVTGPNRQAVPTMADAVVRLLAPTGSRGIEVKENML
jgi:hypothetical protein